ncbi:MAG: hypothetical protein WC584_00775 [Candidatus Pacearchaeota archaeon]
MIIEMSILALEKEIEPIIDFKDPYLCTYYRVCSEKNCSCRKYLAQTDDPSLWDATLLLTFHPEFFLRNNLPTALEILTPH